MLTEHPENSPETNELIRSVNQDEVVNVWCKGCADWRPVNAKYAKYLQGEIESCSKCRK